MARNTLRFPRNLRDGDEVEFTYSISYPHGELEVGKEIHVRLRKDRTMPDQEIEARCMTDDELVRFAQIVAMHVQLEGTGFGGNEWLIKAAQHIFYLQSIITELATRAKEVNDRRSEG